ncbi:hypothetical protein NUW58_g1575 [Xylaria curta]|uniref:Uncharacterized protein n=1 Tax=Xylaria curta TaxID=42375 RepID=A0ACC1PMB9_9PEZI|nr:hypothetical protein NUW58_g1575 [Xylaria curta]
MSHTNDSSDFEGDSDSLHGRQQQKSKLLTDSLYDGPLNDIIRSHPKLFVRPHRWTKHHAMFLRVAYKEEQPRLWPVSEQVKQQGHGGSVQHADKLKRKTHQSDGTSTYTSVATGSANGPDADTPRVPPFQLPNVPRSNLKSHIRTLRAGSAEAASVWRSDAMKAIIMWRKSSPSNIRRTGLHPDDVVSELIKKCVYPSNKHNNVALHRLRERSDSLWIVYGNRKTLIARNCQIYTLAAGTPYAQQDAWRLLYLDRSQLRNVRSCPKLREIQKISKRLGIVPIDDRVETYLRPSPKDAEDKSHKQPLNEGHMSSLFLAMAQERQYEAKCTKKQQNEKSMTDTQASQHISSNNSQTPSQLPPRYQILVTDNDQDSTCIHLYTAHVSDFLLEHFSNPARLPQIDPPGPDSALLKIHHAVVPYTPFKSFRYRLRTSIMKYANGTAGGFFSDPNPQIAQETPIEEWSDSTEDSSDSTDSMY